MTNEVKQKHLDVTSEDIGKYVILPGDPFRTDLIASFLDDAKLVAHKREHKTWTGYLLGEKVTVTSTGMGCPSASIAVEELVKCGATTLIRLGTAGRVSEISKDPSWDGVVVTAAVRDDGLTSQYVPLAYPAIADRHVVDALATAASNRGKKFLEGIAHCKDSYYGQHEPFNMPVEYELTNRWEAWKRANVVCSEMESSALFVVSSVRGVRSGAIMSFKDMSETIQVVCDAIKILIEKDRA